MLVEVCADLQNACGGGGGGEGFIFRLAHFPSDAHGASLGGFTFTLIPVARGADVRYDYDWRGGGRVLFLGWLTSPLIPMVRV